MTARQGAEEAKAPAHDYRDTLFLPQTSLPMKAGLAEAEPKLLARWEGLELYERLRKEAKGRTKFILHDGPPYANGDVHIGTALNKISEGYRRPLPRHDGQGRGLCAGLGLPRAAHRVEGRGKLSRQGQDEGRGARPAIPRRVSRLRRALAFRAARAVQAPGRRGRLGASLHHHGLSGRGRHRARVSEIRAKRRALSRLEARHVVGGRAHRARRSRGRISGARVDDAVREVSGVYGANGSCGRERCYLDDDAMDHPWKPRHRLFQEHFLRPL